MVFKSPGKCQGFFVRHIKKLNFKKIRVNPPNKMTRQEFKTLVHGQRGERFFGYIFFLSPLALALSFLVFVTVEYFKDPVTSFLVWFALIVAVLCGLFAWWGLRQIKRKFRDIFVITFDQNQITDRELINLIAEKMNCVKRKRDSE